MILQKILTMIRLIVGKSTVLELSKIIIVTNRMAFIIFIIIIIIIIIIMDGFLEWLEASEAINNF